jgi:hypothetical protein
LPGFTCIGYNTLSIDSLTVDQINQDIGLYGKYIYIYIWQMIGSEISTTVVNEQPT